MADKDKKQLEATKSVAKDRGGWLTNPFDRELERFFGDRWPRLFDWNDVNWLYYIEEAKKLVPWLS